MKRKVQAQLMLFVITSMLLFQTLSVFAQSLDDVIANSDDATEESQDVGSEPSSEDDDFVDFSGTLDNDILEDARNAKFNEKSEIASKANSKIKKVAGVVVQMLCYLITILLVLRVLIDLAYITLPFSRNMLAPGRTGVAQSAMPGGMGGMGGIGGGFGMNRGFGMGGMSGGMGMGGGMMQQQQQQAASVSVQWVSQAALNAAASEGQQGPDGKSPNALKVYGKDMMVILIMTPIFLVLAISGVLTDLGFWLGSALVSIIESLTAAF